MVAAAWLWPFLLLLLGVFFIILEVFLPSGGVLSVLAGSAVVAGVILAFTQSLFAGAVVLLTTCLLVPLTIALAIRYWPHTPLGRMILNKRPNSSDDVLPDGEVRLLKQLVGKVGRARSKMLPSGVVQIEGRAYDAVSAGMAIDPGQYVVVVAVRMNRIMVRPADPEQVKQSENTEEVLSQSLDNLGLEHPFDEPLT